jgi:hypothetical protein
MLKILWLVSLPFAYLGWGIFIVLSYPCMKLEMELFYKEGE